MTFHNALDLSVDEVEGITKQPTEQVPQEFRSTSVEVNRHLLNRFNPINYKNYDART
jgi:predicted Zn-dependent protease with MMP-like domain